MIGVQLLHYLAIEIGLDHAHTQTTAAEQNALRKYSAGKTSVIEIGVFEGVNTILFANSISNKGVVYGIDPFFKGRMGVSYSKLITTTLLKRNKADRKVKLIEKLSWEAAADLPELVDFIFIDGDHSHEGIKKDWEMFSRKVHRHGYIAMHDTTAPSFQSWKSNMGSVLFFNSHIVNDSRFKLVETVDSLNILQRI